MRPQFQIEQTTEKARGGGLPAPINDTPVIEPGNGNRCSGCSGTIEPFDKMYSVEIRGVGSVRFHDVCYVTWVTFKPVA